MPLVWEVRTRRDHDGGGDGNFSWSICKKVRGVETTTTSSLNAPTLRKAVTSSFKLVGVGGAPPVRVCSGQNSVDGPAATRIRPLGASSGTLKSKVRVNVLPGVSL